MTRKRPARLASAVEPPPRPAAPQAPASRSSGPLLPGLRELAEPRGPYLVPLLLLLATRCFAAHALPAASEDAYITFRYARHLATGHGLVYNPGIRVFGFSSPVWTLWTALGYALGQSPVGWTRITTILADVLTLLLVGRMLERDAAWPGSPSRAAAWCFALFFAVWPFFAVVSVSGMENSAMLTVIALAATLASRGSVAAGPLLALLALWRPEGVACAAVIGLGARPRDRIVGLALFAAGVAALTAYFGSPIPQSLIAKARIYGTPGPWAGHYWWDWALPLRLPGAQGTGESRHLSALAVLLGPAAVAGVPQLWRRRRSALALATSACLVVWLGYALLGVAYFYWYLLVPLAGLASLAAIGLPRIVRGRLIYASLAFLLLTTWGDAYALYMGRAQNEYYGFASVATWLRGNIRPGEKVMLEPIGMVGWQNPVVIVDEVGLVSPAVAARRLLGPGWYADVAGSEQPDWIVIRRGMYSGAGAFAGAGAPFRTAAERAALFSRYAVATIVDERVSGENALVVLRRIR